MLWFQFISESLSHSLKYSIVFIIDFQFVSKLVQMTFCYCYPNIALKYVDLVTLINAFADDVDNIK